MGHDEIGCWSEVKLDIIRRYAKEYSKILSRQSPPFHHVYIDAFAGSGQHFSRTTRKMIPGSPYNALLVEPPFREYHFIELNPEKVESLQGLAEGRTNVHVYHGDCNQILLEQVFPQVRYSDRRRGLCLLDPYGLHLEWSVIHTAGQMESIEIFLNFPTMDMNMNAIHRRPENVKDNQAARMTTFWGDESWKKIAYEPTPNLLGWEDIKVSNDQLAEGFRERLKRVAGFRYVPEPLPMRNSRNSVAYYLFFASHNDTGREIVEYIFKKYR
ncbi:MAG: three-Cys-motif partner protein TcmP [Betaproteobacteria bacterium]